METPAVIYSSRYGHTERYARFIAGELGTEPLDARRARAAGLAGRGPLVFGSGLYAGGLGCAKLLNQCARRDPGRPLFLFTVGLADPSDPAIFQGLLQKAFPPEVLSRLRVYHLRGGIDYRRLGPVHRLMMAMLAVSVRRKPPERRDEQDRQLLETYGKRVDFTDLATAGPLIRAVKAACGEE